MEEDGSGTGDERTLRLLRNMPMHFPSEKGIRRVAEFYRSEYGRELTEDGARHALQASMHLLAVLARMDLENQARGAAGAGQDT